MQCKKIVLDIDENGDCSMEGKGFVGPECQKFMNEVERDLGETVSESNKAEFRARITTRQDQRERN